MASSPPEPVGGAAPAPSPAPHLLARVLGSREFGVLVVILLLCAAMPFTSANETFFSRGNIQNILRNVALLSIFAIGETLVIIAGGIDLSLGSLIAFTGMVLAFVATKLSVSLVPLAAIGGGVLAALAVAILIGIIHATLIHRLRLPPFVVTLASLLILRSQALLLNRQLPITLEEYPGFLDLANGNVFEGSFFPIPKPLVILALVAIVTAFLLNKTRVGRYLYSIGSNETATRLSGVNVYRVKLFAYGMSALLGGMAGMLYAGYGGQGDPQAGGAYELDAVAASVVGGANLLGGQGSVTGTLLGALLLYVVFSAINLTLESPDLYRGTVVGGVLLFAVLVTAFQQRRTA